ncbi:MAG: ABC transporter substrate-binding protein [Flavobacteriales bacterium]|nr:ABC transporter substrate-binding protein [Flavobacteriales bacterium]
MRGPLAIVVLLLAACGGGSDVDPRQVFRYNEAEGITSLDPAFARNLEHIWVVDQLFDGLVEMGSDLRVRPGVAERWTVSDSGTTYTFHLRTDARFHDDPVFPDGAGRVVTARDAAYSLERLRDPATASPGRWVLDAVRPGPQGIEVLDDSTLIIRLHRPFAPFLSMLAMAYCGVVPQEAVAHYGAEWRRHPVGCGPFRFFHWREGVKLALQRHPHYHQRDEEGVRLPYLDAVTVGFVKDPNAEYLALVKGELDLISGTEGGFLNELLDPLGRVREKHAERIRVLRAPALATDYLGFLLDTTLASMRESPWRDARLREAVSLAIDRERIVTHLLHGIGRPARSILPPGLPGGWDGGNAPLHDPDRARALLAEADHLGGKGLPPLVLTTTASYLDICEFIQHELAEYGITVQVDVVPLSTHKQGVAGGDFLFFRKNWIADYPDAENFLLLFATANSAPAGPNYTRFSDPDYDAIYDQALRSTDDGLRLALYEQLDSTLQVRTPAVFLLHPEVVRFVRSGVEGLQADPMNQLDLRRVRKAH